MTAVDEKTDTDLIEHLDFAPRCTARVVQLLNIFGAKIPLGTSEKCNQPAVAAMRCRVCSVEGFVCAPHRSEIASMDAASCGNCNASGPGLNLFEFTPLPGGVA